MCSPNAGDFVCTPPTTTNTVPVAQMTSPRQPPTRCTHTTREGKLNEDNSRSNKRVFIAFILAPSADKVTSLGVLARKFVLVRGSDDVCRVCTSFKTFGSYRFFFVSRTLKIGWKCSRNAVPNLINKMKLPDGWKSALDLIRRSLKSGFIIIFNSWDPFLESFLRSI